MFMTDSGMWRKIADFACSLGVSEVFISEAKEDLNEFISRFAETEKSVASKCTPEERDNSLSWQTFYPWIAEGRFLCLYLLFLSGFRHTALRELRFYFETSARGYYVDSKYHKTTYERKVKVLKQVRWKHFKDLLIDLPNKKRDEFTSRYDELCDYVHLSEISQMDALRDFGLNLALRHPEYEQFKLMLEKTFEYSKYLLLRTLERM